MIITCLWDVVRLTVWMDWTYPSSYFPYWALFKESFSLGSQGLSFSSISLVLTSPCRRCKFSFFLFPLEKVSFWCLFHLRTWITLCFNDLCIDPGRYANTSNFLIVEISFTLGNISICCADKGIFKSEPSFSDPNSNECRAGQGNAIKPWNSLFLKITCFGGIKKKSLWLGGAN